MSQELFAAGLPDYFGKKDPRNNSVISVINELGTLQARLALVSAVVQDSLWEYDVGSKSFHPIRERLVSPDLFTTDAALSLEQWAKNIHPDDLKRVKRKWREGLARQEPFRIEYRERLADGHWRWIISAAQLLVKGKNGAIEKVMGIKHDVTTLRRQRQDLQLAEKRLGMIFNNAGLGIALVDHSGILRQVNPAMLAMSGFSRSEMVGKPISAFAHNEDAHLVAALFAKIKAGEEKVSIPESRFVEKNGAITWVSVLATSMTEKNKSGTSIILMMENVTERHNLREKLVYEATHDSLTGVHNRAILLDRLSSFVDLAKRHYRPLVFCMADIDHFKLINDRYGHPMGDQVLAAFASALCKEVRDCDVVGRYGGEEFGIIFPETDCDSTTHCLDRIRTRLKNTFFTSPKNEKFSITATFGLADYLCGQAAGELVAAADQALYEGKVNGRDCIVSSALRQAIS